MSNVVINWVKKELGIVRTEVTELKPEIVAWAANFLLSVTPVVKQAAEDAVMTAVTVPGPGSVKFAAATAAATADLVRQGVPIIEEDLKAAVQISYNALPDRVKQSSAAAAVQNAANTKITKTAASIKPAK